MDPDGEKVREVSGQNWGNLNDTSVCVTNKSTIYYQRERHTLWKKFLIPLSPALVAYLHTIDSAAALVLHVEVPE
jgi:hypothetical protein